MSGVSGKRVGNSVVMILAAVVFIAYLPNPKYEISAFPQQNNVIREPIFSVRYSIRCIDATFLNAQRGILDNEAAPLAVCGRIVYPVVNRNCKTK